MQKLKQENDYGIGANLRRLRKQKGFTQDQIVAKLSPYGIYMGRVTYNKIEHNYYSIRIKELLALQQILDCDVEEFFIGIKPPDALY